MKISELKVGDAVGIRGNRSWRSRLGTVVRVTARKITVSCKVYSLHTIPPTETETDTTISFTKFGREWGTDSYLMARSLMGVEECQERARHEDISIIESNRRNRRARLLEKLELNVGNGEVFNSLIKNYVENYK